MTEIKTNLQYNVQNYVLDQGTIADKFRILSAGYSVPSEITDGLIDELQLIVNSDGGLPFELQKGNPSSVKVTAELLTLLFSKISGVDSIVEGLITFLVSRQKKDGGFAEALNLDGVIEDKYGGTMGRDWYPVGKSITWLTGKSLEALCLTNYDDQERLRRARDFLVYSQHEDGHWPDFKGQETSDPLGTGNILPALRAIGVDKKSKVYLNGRAALLQHLVESLENKSTYDMVDLTAVGTPVTEKELEVVGEGLKLITNSQNQDGGWSLMGSKTSDPELSSILARVVNKCCKD
ncbi:MAG: prenyltransferase/squalene oxidase repeat-containing protein [Candidatus Thorarchaeota archaeon]